MITLDCSVVVAWCLQEPVEGYADRILEHLQNEAAIVPSHWPLEVGNALLMAERRKRIGENQTAGFLEALAMLPVRVEAGFSLADLPLLGMLSRDYKLTTYDAAYLELALRTGSALATLDTELRNAAFKAGVPILEA